MSTPSFVSTTPFHLQYTRLHYQKASKCRPRTSKVQCSVSVPTTLSDTIALASQSTQAAIESGHKRICVTALPPGLNPMLEETYPFSLPALHSIASGIATQTPYLSQLPDIRILFSSMGSAAAYSASVDQNTPKAGSYAIRDSSDDNISKQANLLVSPITARGDRVMDDLEAAVNTEPDAIWVLLNPYLGIDRASVGMKESMRRAAFREMFVDAFYFRNLIEIKRPQLIAKERGALLKVFPNQWKVFALIDDYVPVADLEEMPNTNQITDLIRGAIAARTVTKTPSGADAQFLGVVTACAFVFIVVYAALQYFPQ